MSSPETMKLPELAPAQLATPSHSKLTEILWRIDPARLHMPEERLREIAKFCYSAHAESVKLEAQMKTIEAGVFDHIAKQL